MTPQTACSSVIVCSEICCYFRLYGVEIGVVRFEFTKRKGAKIILHVKSPTFGAAAKLEGLR